MCAELYDTIFRRVQSLVRLAVPWAGTVYRNATVRYSTAAELLTGEGSRQFGGRWNPPGIRAVYASFAPQTAMAEALSNFSYYGFDIADSMPRVFVAIRVSLVAVLDLTEGATRQRLGVSSQRMSADDWRKMQHDGLQSLTQMVGRAAHTAGLRGFLVSSSTGATGRNIVWFPDNLGPHDQIAICRADELPR